MEKVFQDVGFSSQQIACTLGHMEKVMKRDEIAKVASYANSFISKQFSKYDKQKKDINNKQKYGMAIHVGEFYKTMLREEYIKNENAFANELNRVKDNFSKDLDGSDSATKSYGEFENGIAKVFLEQDAFSERLEQKDIDLKNLEETIAKQCKDIFLSAG